MSYSGGISGTIQVSASVFSAAVGFDHTKTESYSISTTTKKMKVGETAKFYAQKRYFGKYVHQTRFSNGVVERFWSNGYREYFQYYKREVSKSVVDTYKAIMPRIWSVIIPPPKKKPSALKSYAENSYNAYLETTSATPVATITEYAYIDGKYREVSTRLVPVNHVDSFLRMSSLK